MKVRILKVDENILLDAHILDAKAIGLKLPSLTDGWRFNFKKHAKVKGYEAYVIIQENTPEIIEGCLIFEMKNKIEPYMGYVEIAPHNQGEEKVYERVAGCLIAFACRLSFMKGDDDYRGWLAFDILEEDEVVERKLMSNYSQKYHALKFGETTMVIPPEGGKKLIDEFLN